MDVYLYFEGTVKVKVDADPEDDEAWTTAVAEAWAAVPADEISSAANLSEHEIVKVAE